jgi:hypothetical protein
MARGKQGNTGGVASLGILGGCYGTVPNREDAPLRSSADLCALRF